MTSIDYLTGSVRYEMALVYLPNIEMIELHCDQDGAQRFLDLCLERLANLESAAVQKAQ